MRTGQASYPTRCRAAALVLVGAVAAACAGDVPTKEETAAEDRASRLAQVMRIVEATRQGGDLVSAASLYRRAHGMEPDAAAPLIGMERSPDDVNLRNNLALSLALAGAFDESIEMFRELAAAPGATPRVRQNLALVCGLAGQSEQAATVARIDLDDASVRNNLAYYQTLRGLSGRSRAAAILGRHGQGDTLPADPESTDAKGPGE